MAASIERRTRLERDTVESRENRVAGSAKLRQMRKSRYVRAIAGLLSPVRKLPALSLAIAFALGIGISAIVSNSLSPEKSTQQASARTLNAGAIRGAHTLTLKMDDDLSGFPARQPANREAR